MSILYRIDKQAGVTYVLWQGIVSGGDFIRFVGRLTADPDWPPRRRLQLSDLRRVSAESTIDEASLDQAVQIYAKDPQKIFGLKAAAVAADEFAHATLFQRLIARFGPSVIVFNTVDTACTWLGIDPGVAQRTLQQMKGAAETPSGSGRP